MVKKAFSDKALGYVYCCGHLQKMGNFHLPHMVWLRQILGGSIDIHISDENTENKWESTVFKFTHQQRIKAPSSASIIPFLVLHL